jgi:hypothetical protein
LARSKSASAKIDDPLRDRPVQSSLLDPNELSRAAEMDNLDFGMSRAAVDRLGYCGISHDWAGAAYDHTQTTTCENGGAVDRAMVDCGAVDHDRAGEVPHHRSSNEGWRDICGEIAFSINAVGRATP